MGKVFCYEGAPAGRGQNVGDFDMLLASIALTRELIVVTNNEKHFRPTGVRLENWVAKGP